MYTVTVHINVPFLFLSTTGYYISGPHLLAAKRFKLDTTNFSNLKLYLKSGRLVIMYWVYLFE